VIKLQQHSRIIRELDELLSIVREGPVKYVDGKPVKGEPTTFEIKANVQPLNGRELLIVPEGDRFKDQLYLYTSERLLVNDRVYRKGFSYQVQVIEEWGSFRRARVMRIDVGSNASA
jgi:hypothetical protein